MTCVAPALLAALRAPSGGGGGRAVLTEGVLSGGGTSCVLAAVSQHALISTAASAVVKQGRLPHGRGELPTQYAAVRSKMRPQSKVQSKNTIFTKHKKYIYFLFY